MINKITISIRKLPSSALAIIMMILSGMCAATMHCLIRIAALETHPFEIAFFRTIFVILIFLPIVIKSGLISLKINDKRLQFNRAVVGSIAMCCMFYGVSITQLAKSTSLMFTVPIFSTILAIYFLREIVGVKRWTAMSVGLVGAIIVVRPDIELGLGPILVLCASFFWSISLLFAKKLTRSETNISMTFWQAAGLIPATFLISIPFFKIPGLEEIFLFLLIAIAGTLTHFLLNSALAKAELSSLLPFEYLRLIWSVSLGFVFFSEIPLNTIWIGSALIVASTTYIAYRNTKKTKCLDDTEMNTNL